MDRLGCWARPVRNIQDWTENCGEMGGGPSRLCYTGVTETGLPLNCVLGRLWWLVVKPGCVIHSCRARATLKNMSGLIYMLPATSCDVLLKSFGRYVAPQSPN